MINEVLPSGVQEKLEELAQIEMFAWRDNGKVEAKHRSIIK